MLVNACHLLSIGQQESKLEPSEELGDLFKGAGDNDTALACYESAGSTTKVVEGVPTHGGIWLVEIAMQFTRQFLCGKLKGIIAYSVD